VLRSSLVLASHCVRGSPRSPLTVAILARCARAESRSPIAIRRRSLRSRLPTAPRFPTVTASLRGSCGTSLPLGEPYYSAVPYGHRFASRALTPFDPSLLFPKHVVQRRLRGFGLDFRTNQTATALLAFVLPGPLATAFGVTHTTTHDTNPHSTIAADPGVDAVRPVRPNSLSRARPSGARSRRRVARSRAGPVRGSRRGTRRRRPASARPGRRSPSARRTPTGRRRGPPRTARR